MSGLNPLAALAAQVLANADAAMEQATLDLGAAVADLQAQISVGQVIVATVLPPQNGVDYISLLGQNVPAQLPPGINPGEAIAVQVTGFTNTAILVTNLGPVDPANPPTAADLPPVQMPSVALPAQNAILTTTNSPPPAAATAPTAQSTPTVQTPQGAQTAQPAQAGAPIPPVAPPREFFVAASVRDSSAPLPEVIVSDGASVAPAADLEARIALNRTGSPPPPPVQAAPGNVAPTTPRAPVLPSAPLTGRTSVPPIITPSRAVAQERVAAPQAPPPGLAAAARPASPEAALLSRLRIPISAATLLAARGINNAAQSVTSSYQKLEALLSGLPADEQTTSLRTALAFVGKFDLRSTKALPEQIASFISNVVEGAESKIAQIVRAWSSGIALAASEEDEAQTPTAAQSNASQTPGAPAPVPGSPFTANAAAAPPVVSAAVEARSAERMVALDHDIKTAILAMIENPPAGSSPQLNAALREALTATNALQFNVLASKSNDANTITIPLPAYFYDGGKPAQIRISRDVAGGKNAMDADNFQVSFILDTKSLGTVGIDVQTVSRSVSIDVKTQGALSAERFRSTLGELRARLEQLRYRVATIGAGVVNAPAPVTAAPEPVADTSAKSNVDLRA